MEMVIPVRDKKILTKSLKILKMMMTMMMIRRSRVRVERTSKKVKKEESKRITRMMIFNWQKT